MYDVIGVVGAGTMGSGIAYAIASTQDSKVIVCDVDQPALDRGRASIKRAGDGAVSRGRATAEDLEKWLGRLNFQVGLEGLRDADVVVEAVFEDLAVKRATFVQLDEMCQKAKMLASNTSGLSITAIAGATKRPERVIGTHFFNPVPAMKLVEIVRGLQTSDETRALAVEFCKSVGKEVCEVRDFPGFITTRIGQALINEAIRCLEQGVADAENIDIGMKLAFNHPMGPLELADLVGLDVELKILDSLAEELGERFLPSPLLRQMVGAGMLGRKSGQGFRKYS
ncbi:MAG: 3-hydroxyacyl-CoA dehydrogenase family protein [Chloroflexota bacterium]|nr:3-hydroxyacyl-CoA dehydrogenase family protein [Chloroflexota bacterium]